MFMLIRITPISNNLFKFDKPNTIYLMNENIKEQYFKCFFIDPEIQSILDRLEDVIKSGDYDEIQILELKFNHHLHTHHSEIKDDVDFNSYKEELLEKYKK